MSFIQLGCKIYKYCEMEMGIFSEKYVNQYTAEPPTATPAPLIPAQTSPPNNTRQQVIIISMTVVTFFLIIVIVIIKCMNRKKKYVSKNKNLDTQPMLIPNEGNAV